MPITSAARKWRQEDQEFEASLSYRESSRTACRESLTQSKQSRNNSNKDKDKRKGRHKLSRADGQESSSSTCGEMAAGAPADTHRATTHPQCKRKEGECRLHGVGHTLVLPHIPGTILLEPLGPHFRARARPVLGVELAPTSQHGEAGRQVVSQAAVGHIGKGVS